MTELDAVNEVLASIGEAPVNSVGTGLSESRLAQLQLERTSRDVQRKGWYFNTSPYAKLIPNNKGEIQLPRNTLKVDTGTQQLQARGRKLFDVFNRTYQMDGPKMATLVVGLDWEELPESVKIYIVTKASRIFQNDFLGSGNIAQFHLRDEAEALAQLEAEELEAGNYSLMNNPEIAMDNYRSSSKTHPYGGLDPTYVKLTGGIH
jgi:hypothetical protein